MSDTRLYRTDTPPTSVDDFEANPAVTRVLALDPTYTVNSANIVAPGAAGSGQTSYVTPGGYSSDPQLTHHLIFGANGNELADFARSLWSPPTIATNSDISFESAGAQITGGGTGPIIKSASGEFGDFASRAIGAGLKISGTGNSVIDHEGKLRRIINASPNQIDLDPNYPGFGGDLLAGPNVTVNAGRILRLADSGGGTYVGFIFELVGEGTWHRVNARPVSIQISHEGQGPITLTMSYMGAGWDEVMVDPFGAKTESTVVGRVPMSANDQMVQITAGGSIDLLEAGNGNGLTAFSMTLALGTSAIDNESGRRTRSSIDTHNATLNGSFSVWNKTSARAALTSHGKLGNHITFDYVAKDGDGSIFALNMGRVLLPAVPLTPQGGDAKAKADYTFDGQVVTGDIPMVILQEIAA